VKDLRTGATSTSPSDVLDGDVSPFMEASLAQRVYGTLAGELGDVD
jgi:peptide chain release factor 2